jgi:integrase
MATKGTKKTRCGTHVTTPDGSRIYVSGKTKKERDEKVRQALIDYGASNGSSSGTTFEEYAYRWLKAYKAPPRIRQGSYDIIKGNLERHVLPYFRGRLLREITAIDLQEFLNALSPYSKSLQAKCVQIVKAIFRTAVDNRLLTFSPVRNDDFKPAGTPAKVEEPLTPEQSRRLLDAVRGTRAYPFCLLALTTGLRRGEILGLMWEDVDLDAPQPVIHVRHNKAYNQNKPDAPVTEMLKTEAARRTLPLPEATAVYLRELRPYSNSKFVVSMNNGKSLTKNSFHSLWQIVESRTAGKGKELGQHVKGGKDLVVTLDFHCHPHQLRHTYATRLFEAGCDLKQVQYLLGHSKPEMTLRIYVHYQAKSRATETASKVCAALGALA